VLVGTGQEVEVPNVIDLDVGTALNILGSRQLQAALPIEEGYHDSIEVGKIMQQSPLPGFRVKKGRQVRLVKSQGSQTVPVPQLVGKDLRAAEFELLGSKLHDGRLLRVSHPSAESGVIIAQEPMPGARMAKNGAVDLLLSDGPSVKWLIVPKLLGRSIEDALTLLESFGFSNVRQQPNVSPGQPAGMVIGQHPKTGVLLMADHELLLAVSTKETGPREARYKYFSYRLPRALGPGNTEVYLLDDDGERQVHQSIMKKAGRIEFVERIAGSAAVVIYRDGKRVLQDHIPVE
jgi:beta-lactam-binding protein with PASTA domain